MKDCDYISTSQLTHLIECQQQRPDPGDSQQPQYNSPPEDTSESQQQQQQSTATMAAVATIASCLDATANGTSSATSLDYQQHHLHHQHHQHQLQLQQYHQQQAYHQHQQQQHHHHHHAQHHQHHQHVNNYHYAATTGYLSSEHYGDHTAGVAGSGGSPSDIQSQQQQEQKSISDGAEWLTGGHLQAREPLAYSPWLASQQQQLQDNGLQQQVAASQEQYGQHEQLQSTAYTTADSQLAATPTTGHVSPATPVAYNPSAVAALYNSTLLQHQQQSGYPHQSHHHHQLEHHPAQPLAHQHEFGQVPAQHQQQLQNHNQHHHLHQQHHKSAWLHSNNLPLVNVSSPPELHEGLEASLDNQSQQQPHEDGQQRHMGQSLSSFLPGTGLANLHHHNSPNSSTSSSSSSSLMNMSPSSGDSSQLPVTTTTAPPAIATGRVVPAPAALKKASAKVLKRPTTKTSVKKKATGIAKARTGQSLARFSDNSQAAQVALKICQQAASSELQQSSYTNHHLLGAIHVAGPYKDADIEHNETHIVVTNVETGRKVTLSNEQLTSLSVRQLNKMVAGFPRQTITKLKQRRRTLKNRGYAQNCRHKRVSQTKKLERQNQELREENRKLREDNQKLNLLICQLQRQLQAVDTITMTSGDHHHHQHHQETSGAANPKRHSYPIECKATQYGEPTNSNSTMAPTSKSHPMIPFIGKVRELELHVSQLQDQLR